jgi:hypothetical protein
VEVGDHLFNGRVLLERAVQEIHVEMGVDPAELGVAVAAAADLLQALQEASQRLEVRTAEVPDLAAMHAWALRLLDKGSKRRRGFLWLGADQVAPSHRQERRLRYAVRVIIAASASGENPGVRRPCGV